MNMDYNIHDELNKYIEDVKRYYNIYQLQTSFGRGVNFEEVDNLLEEMICDIRTYLKDNGIYVDIKRKLSITRKDMRTLSMEYTIWCKYIDCNGEKNTLKSVISLI